MEIDDPVALRQTGASAMKQDPIIRRIEQVQAREVERSPGATIQVLLGPDDQMPGFYTRRFSIDPGGSIPAHRHDAIEHQQVVLEGQMVLTLDGREQTVGAGQCVYIPAGVAHAYRNRGSVPVRFLCMVPATADYQTEWLE
jgi:quercetin dioxygenase-like cupin family protein